MKRLWNGVSGFALFAPEGSAGSASKTVASIVAEADDALEKLQNLTASPVLQAHTQPDKPMDGARANVDSGHDIAAQDRMEGIHDRADAEVHAATAEERDREAVRHPNLTGEHPLPEGFPDDSSTYVPYAKLMRDSEWKFLKLDADGFDASTGFWFGKREFSSKERASAAESGAALPDGSFPIHNKQDLSNAVQAIGRAKNRGRAMRHIKRRAKALGASDQLPDKWKVADAEFEKLVAAADADEKKARGATIKCAKCGAAMPEDLQKCQNCGAPLRKTGTTSAVTTEAERYASKAASPSRESAVNTEDHKYKDKGDAGYHDAKDTAENARATGTADGSSKELMVKKKPFPGAAKPFGNGKDDDEEEEDKNGSESEKSEKARKAAHKAPAEHQGAEGQDAEKGEKVAQVDWRKTVAERHAEITKSLGIEKGMSLISRLAMMLEDLRFLCQNAAVEQAMEGDDSGIADRLDTWLSQGCALLQTIVSEECQEVVADEDVDVTAAGGQTIVAMMEKATHWPKIVAASLREYAATVSKADGRRAFVKALAEKFDAAALTLGKEDAQKIHDMVTPSGARCDMKDITAKIGEAEAQRDQLRSTLDKVTAGIKSVTLNYQQLQKEYKTQGEELAKVTAELAALKKMPLPSKGRGVMSGRASPFTLSKGDDSGSDLVKAEMGSEIMSQIESVPPGPQRAEALLRMAHLARRR